MGIGPIVDRHWVPDEVDTKKPGAEAPGRQSGITGSDR